MPLYALVQQRSDAARRSRVIAANNVLNALFMVVASLYGLFALNAGMTIPTLFFIMALMNAAVAVFIFMLVPEFIMRLLVWLLIHMVYRVRKIGLENIPDRGPVVLVCNHVSFVDALVLAGCIRRPVRFVMYYKIFNMPILSFIFRTANAIPVAGAKEDAKLMEQAFEKISHALDDGQVICIFPEGKITADGEMGRFKSGISRILQRNLAGRWHVVEVRLWGSFFSRKYGNAMSRAIPRGFFSKIDLVAGEPIAASEASTDRLSEAVLGLRGDRR